jgi:uncharacterized membrane protein YjdF
MTARPSSSVLDYASTPGLAPGSASASRDSTLRAIAIVASIVFVIISVTARVPTYRVNPVFLIPLMWAPYLLRRRLFLQPLHYALYAVAILIHDLGAYGFYQRSPLPFSYDILVHFYFAVAVTLLMHRALGMNFPVLRPWQVNVTALLFMMGLGAMHEIMEYMSYLMLGEEKGMLKPHTSYFFDTQRDLTNNLLGAIVALVVAAVISRRRGGRAVASHEQSG